MLLPIYLPVGLGRGTFVAEFGGEYITYAEMLSRQEQCAKAEIPFASRALGRRLTGSAHRNRAKGSANYIATIMEHQTGTGRVGDSIRHSSKAPSAQRPHCA